MVLVKHMLRKFVNKNSFGGYCENMDQATKFNSVFEAMKYLHEQDEDDITEFDFIDTSERKRKRKITKRVD